MYILGVNSIYHESSACLLRDGVIVATAEEERFNRVKHGKQARVDNPDELPELAINFCLESAGIGLDQIDHIALPADPHDVEEVVRKGLPVHWETREGQVLFLRTLREVPGKLCAMGFQGTFHWIPHHTAHGASAYFVSPHSEAAVLVIDAIGDDAYSTRFYRGLGSSLTCLQSVRYPASIGFLWELFSAFLGFGVYDAAKVMGLAAYGEPKRYAEDFDRLAWATPDGGFDMAHDLLRFNQIRYYPPSANFDGVGPLLGLESRQSDEPLLDVHHDLAAALQQKTDELVAHMARHLHTLTGSPNLCLAGGVALNCVTNEQVFRTGPYDHLYVQPAAHDGGLALGAAFHVWNDTLGNPRGREMSHAYWGPSFTDDQIEEELRRRGMHYERVDQLERVVATLISEQHVVSVFQGAMGWAAPWATGASWPTPVAWRCGRFSTKR